jgi:CYTH domain-containing protein
LKPPALAAAQTSGSMNRTAENETEIERKFLVSRLPEPLKPHKSVSIRQGYITVGEAQEIRLRHKEDRYFLTVKEGKGLTRKEVEVELNAPQFARLWPLTQGKRLEKVRHRLVIGDSVLEVDVFRDDLDGLNLVEVEFASTTAAKDFRPPEWFGKEVTLDERYKNKYLALYGRPEEPA